jgi:hypothetical protein
MIYKIIFTTKCMWHKIPNKIQKIRIATMHRESLLTAPIIQAIMQSNDLECHEAKVSHIRYIRIYLGRTTSRKSLTNKIQNISNEAIGILFEPTCHIDTR